MYVPIVVLLTIVLPIGSALAERYWLGGPSGTIFYLGKWYVFWAGGVRLFLAGLRQVFQPGWTLKEIFEIESAEAKPVVAELGFANIAMGLVCLMSMIHPALLIGGAMVSGLYYGLAGLKHSMAETRNANRSLAMATDVLVSAVLALFVVSSLVPGLPAWMTASR